MKTFEHRSFIPAPAEAVQAFHADPRALGQLTMPPTRLQVLRDARTSLTEGEIEFRLWFGPIPVYWHAQHLPGPIPTSFRDRMLRGPMAHWEHEHIFQPVAGGTELIDRLRYEHLPGPRGWLTRLIFDGLPLRVLFAYRHWRTRREVLRSILSDSQAARHV